MSVDLNTTWLATGDCSAEQIVAAVYAAGEPAYTRTQVQQIATAIVHWSDVFGLRASAVAGQIFHETGVFQFGGDVHSRQFNFAGIGATGGVPGSTFATIDDGVIAVLAHHLVYIYGPVENWPAHLQQYRERDPRYQAVLSAGYGGTVLTIGDYTNGRWAYSRNVPIGSLENGYARGIVRHTNAILSQPRTEQPTMPYPFIRGLIDIRHELAREPSHGPNQKRSLSEKRGVVIHYAGADQPIDRYSDKQLIQSYADYHAHDSVFGYDQQGRGFHADGLQYHIGIGRNGEKYLCRDLESVLWHCGAWPQNGTALAINLPIGGNQRATPAQLTALQEVCDDWFAAGHGDRRWETWGHQELSYTGCPGTLMFDFVLPYREGTIVTVQDESLEFPNGKRIIGGFCQFWKSNNGLVTLGPPETNEVDLDDPTSPAVPNNPLPGKRRIQRFQKGVLIWLPELPAGFQVQVLSINEPLFDQARAA